MRAPSPAPMTEPRLIAAAHRGHVDVVRTLIAAKAPLNHVNNLGWTALLEAVVLGNGGADHTAVVEALVKAGADVTVPDRHGTTRVGTCPHARLFADRAHPRKCWGALIQRAVTGRGALIHGMMDAPWKWSSLASCDELAAREME